MTTTIKLYRVNFSDDFFFSYATPATIVPIAAEWEQKIRSIVEVAEDDAEHLAWKEKVDRAKEIRKALGYDELALASPILPS